MKVKTCGELLVLEAENNQDGVYLRHVLKIDASGIGQVVVQDIGQRHTYGMFSLKGVTTNEIIIKQEVAMRELDQRLSKYTGQSFEYMQLKDDMRKLRASLWLRLWFVFCPGDDS